MNLSDSAIWFLLIFIELLLAWGISGLLSTIWTIKGWNAKLVFWVSLIGYMLLVIGIYKGSIIALIDFGKDSAFAVSTVLYCILAIIGILSPIGNLALRGKYPDAFRKIGSAETTQVPEAQSTEQKQQSTRRDSELPSNLGAIVRRLIPHKGGKGHIFISYRRSDSADISGRVYDRLIGKFGKEPIFKDVESIPLGVDFKEYLDQKVGECNVLLAIIGDHWLDASDATGQKRLDDPGDFVRIEIESALQQNIPVIPLLVRGASMPSEESLPISLRKLVFRNGIPIRVDPDFHRDMDRLIAGLEQYVK